MKQAWKLRCIFVVVCISIVLYMGFNRYMLQLKSEKENKGYQLVINEVMANNRSSIRDEEGDFESWIEIFNKGNTAVDLHGFGLSNDSKQPFLWTFPDITIEPEAFLIVWASAKNKSAANSYLNTNFKLNNKDRSIILTAPNDKWNDIFAVEPMADNISYGRVPDGSSELYGLDEGTPGKTNSGEILLKGPDAKRLEGPLFSHDGGFYREAFNLVLTTNYTDAVICYTLDGSVPTKESEHYTEPVQIAAKTNEATVVRARVYKDGCPKSKVITQSFFVDENIGSTYNTPVISLVTDPENLFDYEKGIYVAGVVFDQWKMNNPNSEINRMTPANYNQRGKSWEREASMELFEPDGTAGLTQNIGIRTHGGYSRSKNLKSLSLFPRKDYDDNEYITYDFFDGKAKNFISHNEVNQFSKLLLRTSSTDSEYSLFRDALIQSLVQELMALDTQSSKPCIVYINGKYYGIHNIREAYDKNYVSEHYDMNPEDVVIIKNPTGIAGVEIKEGNAGDEMHYNRIIKYVEENDIKAISSYDYIKTQIDTDNFIEYNVLQIYCDNRDWPGNNVSIWRKRTPSYESDTPYGHDGRWRWMVYDLDYGFGLHYGEKAAKNNTLKMAMDENGPEWPNPPWSTFLLRSLLENVEFKNQFINVFADRLNTIFLPEVVVEEIEAMKEVYYPNVTTHITRWNLHDNKIENWLDEIEGMKKFAIERPNYIRQYITEYFSLSGTTEIRIDMNEGGTIKVNSLNIENTDIPWKGIYFKDIPITVEAIPEPGFIFAGWEGIDKPMGKTITIKLSQALNLKAIFKSDIPTELSWARR